MVPHQANYTEQMEVVAYLDSLRRPAVVKHRLHFFDVSKFSRRSPVFFGTVREPFQRFREKFEHLRLLR